MPIHKFLFRNCGGSALHLSDDMQLFGISGSYFCGKVKVVCMVCWGLLLAFWKSFYSFVLNKKIFWNVNDNNSLRARHIANLRTIVRFG